jgi:hypothetical protein
MKADGTWDEVKPDDIRAMKDYIAARRAETTPFDIVVEGETPGADPEAAANKVRPWAEAGATWWIETMWNQPPLDDALARIRQGPPRLA